MKPVPEPVSGRDGPRPRAVWPPDLQGSDIGVVGLDEWGPDLLRQVGMIGKRLGVPVQAVRSDRVVSFEHLRMAFMHHERAVRTGRAGPQDPGLDFLRYAAAEKQITRALAALGVPLKDGCEEVPVLLVALGRVDRERFTAAVEQAGLRPLPVVFPDAGDPDGGTARVGVRAGAAMEEHWDKRFALPGEVSFERRQARLFAQMALVALDA